MHPRGRIEYRSAALRAAGQWRDPEGGAGLVADGMGSVDVRSNDYLGLAPRVVSRETDAAGARIGAGASRLVSGTWPAHLALEASISEWLQTEACLLFSSGYAANLGTLSALAGPGEVVLSDALNHASIIDGCRLSRAEVVVLPHGNVEALERALSDTRGVRWVVTETYFGMDGDTPDLRKIRRLCDAHSAALIVDEAHALGVFGPDGRGLCAEVGVTPDVMVGGMGKALGVQGGFAASSRLYRDWLWNRARSMVFSTATSPLLCELAAEQVSRVRAADFQRHRLKRHEVRLMARLDEAGVPTTPGRHGPVFPILLGSEVAVLAAALAAAERGVHCQPIRPPTVPSGKSRLRVSLRADMSDADIETLADVLVAVWSARRDRGGATDADGWSEGIAVDDENERVTRASPGSGDSRRGVSSRAHGGEQRPGPTDVLRADDARALVVSAAAAAPTRPWLVVGTGTGVGKTFVARALVEALARTGRPVAGLKPVETGLTNVPFDASDAGRLAGVSFHVKLPTPLPLYGYPDPIAPARAARNAGATIDLARITSWARTTTISSDDPLEDAGALPTLVVETAGGVFSPLNATDTNFELARALDPATWILVAPDRLGVLHDVASCLCAMTALGRRPDWLILSAPELPDASTGTNAQELTRLPACPPIIELPRNDAAPLLQLLKPHASR